MKPLRVGVVPYLNVAPIVYGLKGNPRFELVEDLPSALAERLHAGDLDLGMIPSIEYARGEYAIVPGIAIGSRGRVGSVCLFHNSPLEAVRRVAIDVSSRTSTALLRIVLKERLGSEPEYIPSAPPVGAMLARADAALVIGDPALYFDGTAEKLDLGNAWFDLTHLPFVFAFWAGRKRALLPEDVGTLQASLADGLRSIQKIASSYNGSGIGRAAQNEEYLRGRIAFDLGEEQVRGLTEFFRRAQAANIIPHVPEIVFYEHP